MKKTIILVSVTMLISTGMIFSAETNLPNPVTPDKIMEIAGKINAIMTDIPAGQPSASGVPLAYTKIKIKDPATGQEHSIQIAPGHYLRQKGIILQKNDQIKVKAFRPENSPEIRSMQIEIRGQIIVLRDQFGKGLWEKPDIRTERREYQRR